MNRTIALTALLLGAGTIAFSAESGTQSLDLKGVCTMALRLNPALTSARATVNESGAALLKAKGAMLPSLAVRSSYGYISKATFFGTTPVLENNTQINRLELVQPIYSGGQMQAAASAAKWGMQASASGESATRSQIVANAASAYFVARETAEAIEIAGSSVKHLESSHNSAQKLFESGVVTKSDVLRAEVALTTARDQLIRARNDHATALAALKTAMGLPQTEAITLAGSAADSTHIGNLAARKRPEVVAAEFMLKASQDRVRAAKGAAKPGLVLAVDFQNQPAGAQFPRLTNTLGVGLMAKLNLFDGKQTQADIDGANASVIRAEAEVRSISQSAALQIESAKLALASAQARVEMLRTQVSSAEESFRVIEGGYKEGINVLTDVLSAESMLTTAQASKLAADYDLKIAEVNLLLALGQTDALLK